MAEQLWLFDQPEPEGERYAGQAPQRTAPGDLWQLGKHRLFCADISLDDSRDILWGGVRPSACITDPPYGIKWKTDYTQFTGGKFRGIKRLKYAPVHGDDMPFIPAPYLPFKSVVLWGANNFSDKLPPGAWLIWDKRTPSGHALLADAEAAWMNRGRGVYIHAHMWQGVARKDGEPRLHPTQKPIALMEWCLEKSRAGATVFDPFCGSGPVLLACERTGRACYAAEIEPRYCDIIVQRWEQMTGKTASKTWF